MATKTDTVIPCSQLDAYIRSISAGVVRGLFHQTAYREGKEYPSDMDVRETRYTYVFRIFPSREKMLTAVERGKRGNYMGQKRAKWTPVDEHRYWEDQFKGSK
jgi:hypothetical protein